MTSKSFSTSMEENQENAQNRRAKGEFVRGVSGFRGRIGDEDFPAEPNRYHLFVALNCPWCHRVTLARNILGLQNSISLDIAFPNRTDENDPEGPNFWQFSPERAATLTGEPFSECTKETGTGFGNRLVKDIYVAEGSEEKSVPILYDKKNKRIVNNESPEIVRMLDEHALALGSTLPSADRPILLPKTKNLQSQINELNDLIYRTINNGAYKAGFSSDQHIYATAFQDYFETLDKLETLLSDGRLFLVGDSFTEVDLRLFPTLYRHDPVYYLRMKLNGAKILDYPYLWRWLCRVYAIPGSADSNSLDHCRQGYFGRSWNNTIPLGSNKPMAYPEAYNHPELARGVT